jgi:hypothetical protein
LFIILKFIVDAVSTIQTAVFHQGDSAVGKKLSAEFLGTFWLVLGGGGSAVLAGVAYRGIFEEKA